MSTKDKMNSLKLADLHLDVSISNKCDWCLSYGENMVAKKKIFKRNMLKDGKSIHIYVCDSCEDKLKGILED